MTNPDEATPAGYLTVEDVAQRLSVTRPTARALIIRGEIPGFQVGPRGLWRVDLVDFLAYVEQQKSRAALSRASIGDAGVTRDQRGVR